MAMSVFIASIIKTKFEALSQEKEFYAEKLSMILKQEYPKGGALQDLKN